MISYTHSIGCHRLSLCCSSICSSILVVVTCLRCVCVCSITVGVVVRSIVHAALSGVSRWLVMSLVGLSRCARLATSVFVTLRRRPSMTSTNFAPTNYTEVQPQTIVLSSHRVVLVWSKHSEVFLASCYRGVRSGMC